MPTALIVEDEPEANKLLAMVVRLRGYRTESAFTGGDALARAVAAPRPDVVMLDLMLPDIDGYVVCSTLKAGRVTNPIPVVMVSARLAADNRLRGLRAGADDYVAKPYTPDQIFHALAAADRRRRSLESQDDRGSFSLGTPTEADTWTAIARFRSLVLARTPWCEGEVARLAEALANLEREAAGHARDRGVAQVATACYRRLPDRLTLTLRDDDHWFASGTLAEGQVANLLPLFDETTQIADGREIVFTKYLEPAEIDAL